MSLLKGRLLFDLLPQKILKVVAKCLEEIAKLLFKLAHH